MQPKNLGQVMPPIIEDERSRQRSLSWDFTQQLWLFLVLTVALRNSFNSDKIKVFLPIIKLDK